MRAERGISTRYFDGALRTGFRRADDRGIVYCNSRNEATSVARRLRRELTESRWCSITRRCPTPTGSKSSASFARGGCGSSSRRRHSARASTCPTSPTSCSTISTSISASSISKPDARGATARRPRFTCSIGQKDRSLNEYLIDLDAPPLPVLRELYRGMKSLARVGVVRGGDAAIAGMLGMDRVATARSRRRCGSLLDSALVEVGEDEEGRYVRFFPVSGRVEMERNERYAEGEATREAFGRFADVAFSAPAATLERSSTGRSTRQARSFASRDLAADDTSCIQINGLRFIRLRLPVILPSSTLR